MDKEQFSNYIKTLISIEEYDSYNNLNSLSDEELYYHSDGRVDFSRLELYKTGVLHGRIEFLDEVLEALRKFE